MYHSREIVRLQASNAILEPQRYTSIKVSRYFTNNIISYIIYVTLSGFLPSLPCLTTVGIGVYCVYTVQLFDYRD